MIILADSYLWYLYIQCLNSNNITILKYIFTIQKSNSSVQWILNICKIQKNQICIATILKKKFHIIKWLLNYKTEVNCKNKNENTLLMRAISDNLVKL
jgi:hypothetical protein